MSRVNIFPVFDLLKDLDDEKCVLVLVRLHRLGYVRMLGGIANLHPEKVRALALRGLLNMFGLEDVPVGIGFPVTDAEKVHAYETEVPYLKYANEDTLVDGNELLVGNARAAIACGLRFTLGCFSGLTDQAHFLRTQPTLAKQALSGITIMGGVEVDGDGRVLLDHEGFMRADVGKGGVANNLFDPESAVYLYRRAQELGIPLTVVSRHAAIAAKIPFSFFDALVGTGHEIGRNLMQRQIPALQGLWKRANLSLGDPGRGKLPDRCDRAWFVGEFCAGVDPEIKGEENVLPKHLQGGYNEYDAVALLGAIPALRDRFFCPTVITVRGVDHRVIGLTKENHGVSDVDGVRTFLQRMMLETLSTQ